ncbi:hypothetical protein PILCRDRAFT_826642 [Piloderma croceum F 1598]|uniref:Uncharacterized protein n=1 Tax=Piloderma croceum (strain F 1598) TaxID=765440 RepID=A0A0C3F8H3_PILCF|nr:hypothetical protein PILCRDRAFT_826642 [Piloderma croceum F 1598]
MSPASIALVSDLGLRYPTVQDQLQRIKPQKLRTPDRSAGKMPENCEALDATSRIIRVS